MIKEKKFSRDNIQVAIVDDDSDDRILAKKALLKCDDTVDVIEFKGGNEFLEYLRRPMAELPDIVLMDINMPEKDGFGTTAEIKGDLNLAPLCVLIFSTSSNESDIRKAMEAGANGYIQKPNSYKGLLKICADILKRDWRESCPSNETEEFLISS